METALEGDVLLEGWYHRLNDARREIRKGQQVT
jgi:hypothetical protein